MTLSAKWTAVSFFTLTALAAGSFAFAGCTVTSGNPTDTEGGVGNPPNPPVDSGTRTDGATAATCEGNKQASGDFVNAQCQALLNANCCAELKGCFNLQIEQDAGGATDNCDTFTNCSDICRRETDTVKQQQCQTECNASAPQNVQDAYDAIVACATKAPGGTDVCQ